MSETDRAPVMICATPIMKSGPTRIGRIGTFTLPRTVKVLDFFAGGFGAFVGIGLALMIRHGLSSAMYGAIFGGAGAWFLVNYSPLQGESMLKWFELQFHTTRRSRYVDGERVTLGVGTARLATPPAGRIRLMRSAVRIPSSQYDERGVPISIANRNLPADGQIDPLLFAALSLPGESATSLTPVHGVDLGARTRQSTAPRRARRGADAGERPSGNAAPAKPQRLKD